MKKVFLTAAVFVATFGFIQASATYAAQPAGASSETTAAGVTLVELSNGAKVPQLGLGTLFNERNPQRLNATTRDAVVTALKAGYRHIDTAHGYNNEVGVGQGIIDSGVPREEIWVTSKLWPNEYGEGVTEKAIDDMLKRLQLDYLDCLYLHHPTGDYMGAWRDLEKAYRAGKVKSIGFCNFDNYMEAFDKIMTESEIKPQIMQIELHPFAQRKEARELAEKYNIQIEAWYPIAHADPRLLGNEDLKSIAAAHKKSVVQVILRWHMQEGFCAVPGATNPEYIKENIDIFDFELTEDEMNQIRALDQGQRGRKFNMDYKRMGGFFGR